MRFVHIEVDSPEYEAAKRLRNAVLRVPLGLTLSAEDTAHDGERLHFVALQGDTVVGTVSMHPIAPATVKLRQMAISPALQGKGIGQRLVQFAEQCVVALGYTHIETHARSVAQRFYEQLGYVAYGDSFMETRVEHVAMSKSLASSD